MLTLLPDPESEAGGASDVSSPPQADILRIPSLTEARLIKRHCAEFQSQGFTVSRHCLEEENASNLRAAVRMVATQQVQCLDAQFLIGVVRLPNEQIFLGKDEPKLRLYNLVLSEPLVNFVRLANCLMGFEKDASTSLGIAGMIMSPGDHIGKNLFWGNQVADDAVAIELLLQSPQWTRGGQLRRYLDIQGTVVEEDLSNLNLEAGDAIFMRAKQLQGISRLERTGLAGFMPSAGLTQDRIAREQRISLCLLVQKFVQTAPRLVVA